MEKNIKNKLLHRYKEDKLRWCFYHQIQGFIVKREQIDSHKSNKGKKPTGIDNVDVHLLLYNIQ